MVLFIILIFYILYVFAKLSSYFPQALKSTLFSNLKNEYFGGFLFVLMLTTHVLLRNLCFKQILTVNLHCLETF